MVITWGRWRRRNLIKPAVGFDDEKPESNYSLSTKKKETKVDKFDEMFDKEDDLPF